MSNEIENTPEETTAAATPVEGAVYGQTGFGDNPNQGPAREKFVKANWDNMMKFKNGPNQIRFVTAPYKYWVHKFWPSGKKIDGNGEQSSSIRCAKQTDDDPNCSLCNDKNEKGYARANRSARYYVGIIDRKVNKYKVLDVSSSLWDKIVNLNDNPKWGSPLEYDITVTVNKNASPVNYYNLAPDPKEELSDADKRLADEADADDLNLKCRPFTPDFVDRLVKKARQEAGLLPPDPKPEEAAAAPVAAAVAPPKAEVKADAAEYEFPAADVK